MINIYGAINQLGFGIHTNNMIKAFIDLNVDINLTTIGPIQNDPYFEAYWRLADKNRINFDVKSPSLYIFHDEMSNQSCGSPLYVFSIFETTKLKPSSLAMLKNGPADIILVTTSRHKEILEAHNIGKPIHVINEGIDDVVFNTIPVDKHIDTKKFTYITGGKKEERKNTSKIIKAFMDTMNDKDVALIAHTFNPFANKQKIHPFKNLESWSDINPVNFGFSYEGWDGKGHRFIKNNCDIYMTGPGIQTPELGCLYHSANVGIQISKGEAWDLILSELLACGIPTITSNCLGHSEYLAGVPEIQQKLIIPITGKETANDGIWFKGDVGEWDTISEDSFRDMFKLTWNEREKYETKSDVLGTYMANNYPWTKAAKSFNKLIS